MATFSAAVGGLEQRTQLRHVGLLTHRNCKIINMCCVRPLCVGICHTVREHQYGWVYLSVCKVWVTLGICESGCGFGWHELECVFVYLSVHLDV